nr:5-methyltetrahydropteroyltriglutamate--homocysteine S-methyltransferase [Lapidilactobacillus bayanensis]
MTTTIKPPFRYDIVGSFLRPEKLKAVRADYAAKKITAAELKATEDEAVKNLVDLQLEHGLKAVTDGEFRRSWWHLDFFAGLLGTTYFTPEQGYFFHGGETRAGGIRYVDRVRYNPDHPFFKGFEFLQQITPKTAVAKQTIPSPSVFFPNTAAEIYDDYYGDNLDQLYTDLTAAYQQTIQHFYDLGCRYLQLDDTSWGMWASFAADQHLTTDVSPQIKPLADAAVKIINELADHKPADLTLTMHVCRGNYNSDWAGAGAYDPVADYLAQLHIDGYFLEYDDERSGGFAPLAKIAANGRHQKIVLGLITSKRPELESFATLKARLDDASQYVPLADLCLSPQCGFASTEEGNQLTEAQQWAKIDLVVQTAQQIWPNNTTKA